MEQHLSPSTLTRYFSGQAARTEVEAAISHLSRCPACWERGAAVVTELETAREEEERSALGRLRARARWAELASLSPEQQIGRIKAEADLRTLEMFDTVMEAASAVAPNDPFLGEETALVAYALAGSLPKNVVSAVQRNDLQSEALMGVANGRRLAADWRGSADALKEARRHIEAGTGEAERKARLLSIQASLATDTGQLEQAGASLARAAAISQSAGNVAALFTVTVQEAGSLLAACHYEQAIAQAERALRHLTPKDIRLELLARHIITASLVFLGRPAAALKNYIATRPLNEHLPEGRTDLQADYLEALLLESLGHAREAEMAFRRNITKRMEAELYKDAFLTMLTRFELLFRRGALDKAAQACEEALTAMQEAEVPCREQMERLWSGLKTLVKAQSLSEHQLLKARRYLVRHWNAPTPESPLGEVGGDTGAAEQLPVRRGVPDLSEATHGGPPIAAEDGYEAALERYDRALVMKGLAQCGGRVVETARLLGISRGTLRARIRKYRLEAGLSQDASVEGAEGGGPDWLGEEDRKALSLLRARAWWKDLQPLPTARKLTRIKRVPALQTREMAETILEEAAGCVLSDPRRAEEAAAIAYALAGFLPRNRCPMPVKHDLQGAALLVIANCRRLAGDWQGSAAALKDARSHLDRGTGDPAREARLLSIQASLATDMGHYEEALSLLARAAAAYHRVGDAAGSAFTAVQEAGILLAAGRHSEAVERVEEALRLLAPRQVRLEILARNIVTSSLIYLGRPVEALRNLHTTRRLVDQVGGAHTKLQASYLEALVLDALGFEREADVVFNSNIATRMEAGLYKDAFLTLLTRFELLCKRGELDKAARVCEDAIERLEKAGEMHHAQTIQLWRDLLAAVTARRLTDPQLLEARQALVRCWAAPVPPAMAPAAEALEIRQGRRLSTAFEPPPLPSHLSPGEYKVTLALYDRLLIAEGLARCQGQVGKTSEMLGISPSTLRARMKRYGLEAQAN